MVFTYSKLRKYSVCQRAFYHYYLLQESPKEHEAQVFGKKFHTAIDKLNEANENLFEPEIIKMVKALRANPDFQQFEIKEFEKKVFRKVWEVDKKKFYDFFGIYDALAVHKETGENWILEWKSSDREWTYTDRAGKYHKEKLNDNLLQHSIYKDIYVDKDLEQKCNFGYFIITKHATPRVQFISSAKNELEFMSRNKITDICDAIMNDFEFFPTCFKQDQSKCFLCDCREVCSAWF
mgnify:CR=1 FL=1